MKDGGFSSFPSEKIQDSKDKHLPGWMLFPGQLEQEEMKGLMSSHQMEHLEKHRQVKGSGHAISPTRPAFLTHPCASC